MSNSHVIDKISTLEDIESHCKKESQNNFTHTEKNDKREELDRKIKKKLRTANNEGYRVQIVHWNEQTIIK